MKIVSLVAENFKRLKAVEIKPDGSMVVITGRNAQGKSSVLDSIFAAVGGADAAPSKPIRKGEQSARIKLDLGEVVVTRKFTAAGSTLAVEQANGARFSKPQQMLDQLIGKIAFDPLEFTRMKPAVQFETLRKLVPLEVDIDALTGLNQSDYETRTDVNRRAKQLRAQADGIRVAAGLPDEPVDISALSAKVAEAGEHNQLIERRKSKREQATRDIAGLKDAASGSRRRAAELRAQADEAEQLATKRDEEAACLQSQLDGAEALPEPIDTAVILADISAAQATNQQIAARNHRRSIETEAEQLEKQSADLTATMAARDEQKQKAIAAAKMPIDGLTFGEGEVLYNDLPLDQASQAERIRVSMAVAMALNPKLRVLTIKDGSLIDQDGLAVIQEMIQQGDYQLWLERVGTDGAIGILIEDGAVKASPQPDEPSLPMEAAE
jgi:DNA repair exonuclease SbcCD ATPase subunit